MNIKNAKDNVVFVDRDAKDFKLISMVFYNGRVPKEGGKNWYEPGVVVTEPGSKVQILHSVFSSNKATPLINRGETTIYGTSFTANEGYKVGNFIHLNSFIGS